MHATLSSLLDNLDGILPKLGTITPSSIRRLVPNGQNKDMWKSILLVAEAAHELTGRKSRVSRAMLTLSAICTGISIVNGKTQASETGHYREWREVADLSGIPIPSRIACVPVGPVPPRVVAEVINTIRVGDEIKFHDDYVGDHPVHLVYTSISDCTRHGTTYAITTVRGTDVPYIVLRCSGSIFVIRIPTISVNGCTMMDVVRNMLVAEGTDCSAVSAMIVRGIMSTFDPTRFALYPSDDIATLNDTYVRTPMDTSVTHDGFGDTVSVMRRALDMGISRSYMFYGTPGTGKTTYALQLAWELRDIPLVLLPAAKVLTVDYPLDSMAEYLVSLLEIHHRAIFIMDDLDGCEIVDKNLATTRLIAFLDRLSECSMRGEGTYILMSTVNYIGNISDTIVGRSGRVDELVHVPNPPAKMIMAVSDVDATTADSMVSAGFTMADVTNAMDMVSIGEADSYAEAIKNVTRMKVTSAVSHGTASGTLLENLPE